MVTVKIANQIYISGLQEKHALHIAKSLKLKNPKYEKLRRASGRMARAFFGTPEYFVYFRYAEGILSIPRGMRLRLLAFLDAVGVEYEVTEDLVMKKL